MNHADKIIQFLQGLEWPKPLPEGIGILNPWKQPEVMEVCRRFYSAYYADDRPRTLILGINPGRFGGGMTGIAFTDPIRLESFCSIQNPFAKRAELSSEWVYRVIAAYGGPEAFYRDFHVNSVVPLGFVKDGKNCNYYDDPELAKTAESLIPDWMDMHRSIAGITDRCICLGEGKNLDVLKRLNDRHGWFATIVGLPHPRFILQYRRKEAGIFLERYLSALKGV